MSCTRRFGRLQLVDRVGRFRGEALHRLAVDGLVELTRCKVAQVVNLSPADIASLCHAQAGFERHAVLLDSEPHSA